MQVPVSPEVNALLDEATTLSIRRGMCFVGVEHLYDALMAQQDLLPRPIRHKYANELRTASYELTRHAWRGRIAVTGSEIFYTPRCAEILRTANKLAQRFGNVSAVAAHLLLAILADAHASPSRAMDQAGLPRGEIIGTLRAILVRKDPQEAAAAQGPAEEPPPAKDARRAAQAKASVQESAPPAKKAKQEEAPSEAAGLDAAVRDLTQAARDGKIDPAIGRDKEMLSVLEILARKNKNNAVLIGDAGVGKTRVAEGLALWGVRERTAELFPYRMLELNIAALMAGTQYRGAFEEKIVALLEKLKTSTDTVLFIDEMHLIMGAGSTDGGAMDLANLLKPALARGEIRCIGATTQQEYRKFIEKDPALDRRFQPVHIDPLTPAATWEVLKRMRGSLEKHHGVTLSTRAMREAISLTEQYLPNRHLPDKAIDVIDQACARHRLRRLAARARSQAPEDSVASLVLKGVDTEDTEAFKVTPHDVRKVVSSIAAVPVEEITAEERRRVDNLERRLNRRVIGQTEAVAKVVGAVKRARAGLSDPKRPDASMLFLGPTGVGKTQLAKSLADLLFGSARHLITFDMSEYVERHSVSRLLGAPPGYVGSDEEGRLTGAVRSKPFSILLFDEIEKAHPQIFDIFLPVLDEGRLKDSNGREVSFRNCIIVFTSNIGAELLSGDMGEQTPAGLIDALRQRFRPEFINRIDELVPFRPLLFEDVRHILRLAFKDLYDKLKVQGIGLHVYQGAYELLAKEGYSPEFGARELQRAVSRLVTGPVSEKIVEGTFGPGDRVEVLVEDDELRIRKAEGESE